MKNLVSLLFLINVSLLISQNQAPELKLRQADSLKQTRHYPEALDIYQDLLQKDISEKNRAGQCRELNNIANIYSDINSYDQSTQYYFKALSIAEQLGDNYKTGVINVNIANNYMVMRRQGEARPFIQKAIGIFEKLSGQESILGTCHNISGSIMDYEKKYAEALKEFHLAEKLFQAADSPENIANVYNNISFTETKSGDYKSALAYARKSLALFQQTGDSLGISTAYQNMHVAYMNLTADSKGANSKKDLMRSLVFLDSAFYAIRNMEANEIKINIYMNKSQLYLGMHEPDSAYIYLWEYTQLNDTVHSIAKNQQIVDSKIQYEVEKKEQQNLLLQQTTINQRLQLNQKNYLLIALIFIVGLLGLIGWIVLRQNRLAAQQQAMQLEQKLLRSQMNPHFIFNSLIAIESFIYRNEPKEAGRYLSGFARLMRLILENSREEFVSLEREIQTLEHYLKLQKLRYEDKFSYSIDVDKAIDASVISVPPMLAQPFLENAIEHGLKGHINTGLISVRFFLEHEELVFEVEDNGAGFEKMPMEEKDEKGHRCSPQRSHGKGWHY